MPTITASWAPIDGDTTDADAFAADLGEALAAPLGFDTLNGYLDSDNLAGDFVVTKELVQPGCWYQSVMRGATARVDYYHRDLFWAVDLENILTDPGGYEPRMVGIAGAGASWCNEKVLEWVEISWDILVVGDTDFLADDTGVSVLDELGAVIYGDRTQDVGYRLALFINGRRIKETDFRFKKGNSVMVDMPAPGDIWTTRDKRIQDMRLYSMRLIIDSATLDSFSGQPLADASPLAEGHHTAGIYVVTDGEVSVALSDPDYTHRVRYWGGIRAYTRRFSVTQRYGG